MEQLTVLVCVKDDWRVLRLLESLEHQTVDHALYRAVVVVTGREDYGCIPCRFSYSVSVVRSEQRGLAAARNCGLKEVGTDLYLTTDADCVAAPDLVENTLAAYAAAGEDVAGIGGSIAKFARDTATRRHGITINDGQAGLQYLPASSYPYITGAHASFRTRAVRDVGCYDEQFSCGEDVDICYRLGLIGNTLKVDPRMSVFHEDRATAYQHFQRFRWYATDQALLYRMYRPDGAKVHINSYPWSRLRHAAGELLRGLPAIFGGDFTTVSAAGITLVEAAGVWVGDIQGSIKHRVLYL